MIFLLHGNVFADKMASTIQEAIYLFEMKGEYAEAIRLLEKASENGDKKDKESAFFYLGKIQEILGNNSSANFYYNQSLQETKSTEKAYYLAYREAQTSSKMQGLIKHTINLKEPIRQIFPGPVPYILSTKGTIYKIKDGKAISINVQVPQEASIFRITDQDIWYQMQDKDSLHYASHVQKFPSQAFPVFNVKQLFFKDDEVLALSPNTLSLINKKGVVFQNTEMVDGCSIDGYYSTTNHYIVHCPDNIIRFISPSNGSETYTISPSDNIQKLLIDGRNILVVSDNALYCYDTKRSLSPKWKVDFNNIETTFPFESRYAVLEISGQVTLIDKNTGSPISKYRSDATSMAPMAQGTIGLFSAEGALSVVDTLLRPLWHFNFAKPISQAPFYTSDNIYLTFGEKKIVAIQPRHYGYKTLLSDKYVSKIQRLAEHEHWDKFNATLDTLFELEPGNAEGWFFKALYLEKNNGQEKDLQKAWSEAVRLSVSNPRNTSIILNRYGKTINAKFVNLLELSPKTKYPQFFGTKKNLYTLDVASEKLLCINTETGDLRWRRSIGKMESSPITVNDEKSLVISYGSEVKIYDLTKDAKPIFINVSNKIFSIKLNDNSIYVSTWNGILHKIARATNSIAWSRKIFTVPFMMVPINNEIVLTSLEGEFVKIDEGSGLTKEGSSHHLQSAVQQMASADSIVAVATENKHMYLFNNNKPANNPIIIPVEAPILSIQFVRFNQKNHILVGLENQNILFFTEAGTQLWTFEGKHSTFTTPFVNEGLAWVDQGVEVVGISLSTGKVVRKFSTPGGAGTPFILNRTLFSASPKHLLYGFSL
ncbi:MAG: hypothetical protein HUK21_05335 [Fibrobacteraceae bacterium]|nr:hypothetical protein [Fibrobacteraceae bacterium]